MTETVANRRAGTGIAAQKGAFSRLETVCTAWRADWRAVVRSSTACTVRLVGIGPTGTRACSDAVAVDAHTPTEIIGPAIVPEAEIGIEAQAAERAEITFSLSWRTMEVTRCDS